MKKFAKDLLTVLLVFLLTAFFGSAIYSQESSEKAKQILEKTTKKYGDILKEEGKDLKTVAAKITIKGGIQAPMGGSSMPLPLDTVIELYVAKPHNLYLDISGNLGNAKLVVAGKEKVTATIMLPNTKQFAAVDVPAKFLGKAQKTQEEAPEKPGKMEELWESAILTYEGTQSIKAGTAHKINIKPKDPAEKGSVTVYILDGKWDPAGFEINDPEGGKAVIEFEKLELNGDIPDEKFVANTEGYTQIPEKDLVTAIMMQVMGAMMQQGQQE